MRVIYSFKDVRAEGRKMLEYVFKVGWDSIDWNDLALDRDKLL